MIKVLHKYLSYLEVQRSSSNGMDKWLFMAICSLLVIGTIAIYSATVTNPIGDYGSYFLTRHLFHIVLGVGLAIMLWVYLSVRFIRDYSLLIALAAIITLLFVHLPIIGYESKGASRWISLGLINVQPVEYTKLAVLIYVCAYCASNREVLTTWKGILPPLGVIFIADVFLLLQPDFGSSVILTVLALTILFIAGASLRFFFVIAAVLVPAVVMLITMFPYRMQRLLSFLDPFQDPYGGGYHQTHALMAFGKGGWFGDGLGQSVEKWSHLPEAHTDFIISVLAEETGIVGVLVVLAIYAVILQRAFVIANSADAHGRFFSGLLARTIGLMLVVQMAINVAGNLALGPVKGLTLPLLSYGGSSLVSWLLTFTVLQVLAHDNRGVQHNHNHKQRLQVA